MRLNAPDKPSSHPVLRKPDPRLGRSEVWGKVGRFWVWSALLRASYVGTQSPRSRMRPGGPMPSHVRPSVLMMEKEGLGQTGACKYSKYTFYVFHKLSGCGLCQNVLWVSSDLECFIVKWYWSHLNHRWVSVLACLTRKYQFLWKGKAA